MPDYIKHSVKISPVEMQEEAPYAWYPSSAINASNFGATSHLEVPSASSFIQKDDLEVLEGDQADENIIWSAYDVDYSFEFIVILNTGNTNIALKFDKLVPANTSGYVWYLGKNEIWATAVAGYWQEVHARGIGGAGKVSLLIARKHVGAP